MSVNIGNRIKSARYAKGMKTYELAQKAEITEAALRMIESGKTKGPRANTVMNIANALGVPRKQLLAPEPGVYETKVAGQCVSLFGPGDHWTEEDWKDLHESIEALKRRITNRRNERGMK